MSSNGYELGTAQTYDRATPKFQDLSGDLPSGDYTIENCLSYDAENELILIVTIPGDDREFYRSVNGGESWELFWEIGAQWGGDWFETRDGSLLFAMASNSYRYTGGGTTPTQVAPISGYSQGFTQTEDGTIYVAEYDTGGDGNHTDIYKSTDDGQNFNFVVNVADATGISMRHLHGIASQGNNRLFVATGDTEHEILDSTDEFSTHNRYVWRTEQGLGCSYTGIVCENNALILGADHVPTRLSYMWVGTDPSHVDTDAHLSDGMLPKGTFHVMPMAKRATDSQNVVNRYRHGSVRAFFHRIESDGTMLYSKAYRNNMLAVSTTNGRTWKWIETPVIGRDRSGFSVGDDALYLAGRSNDGEKLIRVPKESLFAAPEPQTQTYHILKDEPIGESSTSSNSVFVARDLPFEKFTDFRFGVTTDGQLRVSLFEDAAYGTSVSHFDYSNARLEQDVTSTTSFINLNDAPNGGFSLDLLELEASQRVTTSMFVQCSR